MTNIEQVSSTINTERKLAEVTKERDAAIQRAENAETAKIEKAEPLTGSEFEHLKFMYDQMGLHPYSDVPRLVTTIQSLRLRLVALETENEKLERVVDAMDYLSDILQSIEKDGGMTCDEQENWSRFIKARRALEDDCEKVEKDNKQQF
jgi:GTP1/Obg family GTP-binding protein